MPMATNEEHGAQNPNNPYCIHCTDMNGKLLPFEKKFEELVKTAMDTRWMNREQAEKNVLGQMAELPAWRGRVAEMKLGATSDH
jgi:Putative zinc ribbon domain